MEFVVLQPIGAVAGRRPCYRGPAVSPSVRLPPAKLDRVIAGCSMRGGWGPLLLQDFLVRLSPSPLLACHLRFCLYPVLDSLGSLALFKAEVGKENRSISKTSIQASGTQTVHRERRDLTEVSTHWPLETLGLFEAKGNAWAQDK